MDRTKCLTLPHICTQGNYLDLCHIALHCVAGIKLFSYSCVASMHLHALPVASRRKPKWLLWNRLYIVECDCLCHTHTHTHTHALFNYSTLSLYLSTRLFSSLPLSVFISPSTHFPSSLLRLLVRLMSFSVRFVTNVTVWPARQSTRGKTVRSTRMTWRGMLPTMKLPRKHRRC